MNPFNPSTSDKKSLKKKHVPSTSSHVLTTSGTRIRKPFHQIYLEELSRKAKIASVTEIDTKEVGYPSSKHVSRLTKRNNRDRFAIQRSYSCDDLAKDFQRLRLSENNDPDVYSKTTFMSSTAPTLSYSSKPCTSITSTCSSKSLSLFDLNLPVKLKTVEVIEPLSVTLAAPEKNSNSSDLTHSTSQNIEPSVLSLSQNMFLLSINDSPHQSSSKGALMKNKTDSIKASNQGCLSAKVTTAYYSEADSETDSNEGFNQTYFTNVEETVTFNDSETQIDISELINVSMLKKVPELSSFYESFYGESPGDIDIFKPLEIPSYVKPSSTPSMKPEKNCDEKTNNTEPSTSTPKDAPSVYGEVSDDTRTYDKKFGSIDIFKPLEIPSYVKPSSTPSMKPEKNCDDQTNNTEPSTSTPKVAASVYGEVSDDTRAYYKKFGAIPKSCRKQHVSKFSEEKPLLPIIDYPKIITNKPSRKNVTKDFQRSSSSLAGAAVSLNTSKDTHLSIKRKRSREDSQKLTKTLENRDVSKSIVPEEKAKLSVHVLEDTIASEHGNVRFKHKTRQEKVIHPCEDPSEKRFQDRHHAQLSKLPDPKKQCGETSAPEHSPTAVKNISESVPAPFDSEAITEEKPTSLGDFKCELGEAILDSIFFGNDYDDCNEDYGDNYEEEGRYVICENPGAETHDEGKFREKYIPQINVSPILQIKPFRGQGGGADSPDLEFVYDDTDAHGNEIAELYSYTEQPELQLNVKAFEDQMESYNLPPSWQRLSVEKRKSVIMKLLDQLEVSKKPLRMRSARCLLYIAQGCWAEMQSDTEQQHWARINCMLLYQLGAFSAFTDLLNIEIENSTAAHVAMRKIAVSLADSQDLRVILSVLYTITEVIRNESATDNSEYKNDIDAFCFEIGNAFGDELLVIKLLGMVTRFCSGAAPHFPMKKVLLLLWKLILASLGGMTTLKELKAEKRKRAGLPPQNEDTMEIAKTMRSSSPPASASDLLEAQNQKRNTRPFRRSLMKQSSLDDQESLGMEMETTMGNDNGDDLADMAEYDERRPSDNSEASQMYSNHNINMYNRQMSPPPQHDVLPRGLPWKPKVRQKDIDMFLDGGRQKFLGYSLPGDQATLFGLPEPIHEGVKILKEHVYTSLAELQIQKEEEIARNPLSTEEDEIDSTPAEMLYQAMLPNLPQYMIALLKILLAAAPTSKAKTDSINIMADVLPEEMPMTVLQSMKLGIDVNRHKEIIVKAVSAILLLLLKHFKLNHIYQFEFMSQHLVFANCIPLVLKFFNQNIMAYVGAKNVIPILDFPSCVIGDQPELTAESLEIGDAASFSWRNMFSCINLLRILNKLTKWKHSRIMMLVVFKSAPILKRTLKVRHAMTQLYVLKLLKMQTKYLGRQWRKSNMKTISAIYQKVRHRLNDDWAYGNDLDARPWDFQAEECALRASVDRFNNRRYTLVNESDFEPVDNCLSSVLGANHELSENFKAHYDLWLEQEVFGIPIEWEKLLLDDNDL